MAYSTLCGKYCPYFLIFSSVLLSQVVKILNATDEHVMALGANFSLVADSHLVCMQVEQGYKTQAINIQNQPRKGTCSVVQITEEKVVESTLERFSIALTANGNNLVPS